MRVPSFQSDGYERMGVYMCVHAKLFTTKKDDEESLIFWIFLFGFFLQAQVTSQIALPAIHEFVILMKHKYEKSVALLSSRS